MPVTVFIFKFKTIKKIGNQFVSLNRNSHERNAFSKKRIQLILMSLNNAVSSKNRNMSSFLRIKQGFYNSTFYKSLYLVIISEIKIDFVEWGGDWCTHFMQDSKQIWNFGSGSPPKKSFLIHKHWWIHTKKYHKYVVPVVPETDPSTSGPRTDRRRSWQCQRERWVRACARPACTGSRCRTARRESGTSPWSRSGPRPERGVPLPLRMARPDRQRRKRDPSGRVVADPGFLFRAEHTKSDDLKGPKHEIFGFGFFT